jgi:hypothetical protein
MEESGANFAIGADWSSFCAVRTAADFVLRHAVLWRKMSGGTSSGWGCGFVERDLSVAATCGQRGLNVMDYQRHRVKPISTAGGCPI